MAWGLGSACLVASLLGRSIHCATSVLVPMIALLNVLLFPVEQPTKRASYHRRRVERDSKETQEVERVGSHPRLHYLQRYSGNRS